MDTQFIIQTFFLTLKGVPVTVAIMAVSLIVAFLPALGLALGRIHQVKGVTGFAVVYLAVIRATPPILLILFFYSLFPSLLNRLFTSAGIGIDVFQLNPIWYAFAIFSLLATGSLSEVLRAALLTVDKGQLEAGRALGMTDAVVYRRVVFPQALANALPNLCNLTINLVKGTSLVFVMTVQDITAIAKIQAAYGYHYVEAYLVIFVVYLLLCGGIQLSFSLLQKHFVYERKERSVTVNAAGAKYQKEFSPATGLEEH